MKTYQFKLEDYTIEYDVEYSHRKTISMQVKSGRLLVKAPFFVNRSYIEEMIIRYKKRLIKKLENYNPLYEYKDKGFVYIFNQRYEIALRDLQIKKCEIHDDKIYVYHSMIEETIEKYLKQLLYDYIEEKIIYYLAYEFDLIKPEISIRKYKGRWGSCFYKENKVSFNSYLVHLDKKIIDYVIVHELSHFLETNHSKKFYQEIEKRMPDYKERIKMLKEVIL